MWGPVLRTSDKSFLSAWIGGNLRESTDSYTVIWIIDIILCAFASAVSFTIREDKVKRKVYPQIPPKVEYSLTERGSSLVTVLDKLCDWENENRL
ncbi:MAG: winged helix-turn-helix transcriptional regulator [Clostridia bacterium]|nr:winged helix-turn-helix transcriptional regulator [Clostridia bacterium]